METIPGAGKEKAQSIQHSDLQQRQTEPARLMDEKVRLEHAMSGARLGLLRAEGGYASAPAPAGTLRGRIARLREAIAALDERIAPLARDSGDLLNPRWLLGSRVLWVTQDLTTIC